MSQIEKLIQRLKNKPKDFTYDELKKVLNYYEYKEYNKGKSSGSRVQFVDDCGLKYEIHKPHPSNCLKPYQIDDLLNYLKKSGVL